MSRSLRDHELYAQLFRDRPEGWAVYENTNSEQLSPGHVGYFRRDGNWVRLDEI
jgi:hypothetical protein